MYDTFVRKHCLTSRKTINILTGVTAMFVGGGGLFLYYVLLPTEVSGVLLPKVKSLVKKTIDL